jgi:RimJ/RimL family protein N-acetyltransferase
MKAANLQLRGPRVTIRPLCKIDLDVMSTWPRFEDPLYRLFDWPKRSPSGNSVWYARLVRDKTRVYYAVDNEEANLIGRISLREIYERHSARLGIGFGTHYVSQGYGTESLTIFLRHYFADLGFERMVLDVCAANRRAVRCYERCGFEYAGSHYEYAGTDAEIRFLQNAEYAHLRRFFRKRDQRHWMLSYDMSLTRENWLTKQRAQGNGE